MTLNKNLQFLIDNVPNKRIIGLQGGTRSAKTYSALQFVIRLISKHSGFKISITRDTYNALKATAMEDFFELLNSVGMYHPKNYNRTDHIYYHNGNVVDFFGLDSPGKVQGRKRHILLVDEAIGYYLQRETTDFALIHTKDKFNYNQYPGGVYWLTYESQVDSNLKFISKYPIESKELPNWIPIRQTYHGLILYQIKGEKKYKELK
jgi:hypothetical protein